MGIQGVAIPPVGFGRDASSRRFARVNHLRSVSLPVSVTVTVGRERNNRCLGNPGHRCALCLSGSVRRPEGDKGGVYSSVKSKESM